METNANQGFAARWTVFCMERFPPLHHLPLILFYVGANAAVAFSTAGTSPRLTGGVIGSSLIILFVFFHLRVFDEIKDFRKDVTIHPERPLPRGLITVAEAGKVAAVFIAAECLLGLAMGMHVLIAVCLVIAYSLLMYREFFVADWLRPRLATYAFTHTAISCWMSLVIYSAATGRFLWEADTNYGLFLVANMMMFNIFEFGRKTYGREEESELVESYSKTLKPAGAAGSVFLMALIASAVASHLGRIFGTGQTYFISLGALLGLTLLSSIFYVIFNNARSARVFRAVSALFLLLFTVIITGGFWLKGVIP